MKILTISVAAYGVEKYIAKLLDSLSLDVTQDDIEVIINNDCGTDNTMSIVNEYYIKYPKAIVINNQNVNKGYGGVFNDNLAIAKGLYFRCLDGDDYFHKENFLSFLDFLKNIDNSTDLVISNYEKVDPDYKTIQSYTYYPIPSKNLIDFYHANDTNYIPMHAITCKTKHLINLNVKMIEKIFYTDTIFAFGSQVNASIVEVFPKVVYMYLIGRPNQTVNIQVSIKNMYHYFKVFEYILEFVRNTEKTNSNIILNLSKIHLINSIYKFNFYTVIQSRLFDEAKINELLNMNVKYSSQMVNKLVTFPIKLLIKKNKNGFDTELYVDKKLKTRIKSILIKIRLMKKIKSLLNENRV